MQKEHLVDIARLVLLISLAWDYFCQVFQLDGHVLSRRLLHELGAGWVGRSRARLHPGVHLRDYKVEALLRIRLIIEDELAPHVIQLK